MTTNLYIAFLVALMVNVVLFGTGAITVLSIPALSAQAVYLLPAVIVASLLLTPVISWPLAPMLRSKAWHDRHTGISKER
ncbi:MAG TPA: hypothetical protein P5337_05280 [Aestuariivirga sp.]|nr:hypothetical protein [Aestuariivirga sp.]